MVDPVQGTSGDAGGGLPPAPQWGGDSAPSGDIERFPMTDSEWALPTLETVDDLIKELPCDASAPDLALPPKPRRAPLVRMALVLTAGAVLGALTLGGVLIFWKRDVEKRSLLPGGVSASKRRLQHGPPFSIVRYRHPGYRTLRKDTGTRRRPCTRSRKLTRCPFIETACLAVRSWLPSAPRPFWLAIQGRRSPPRTRNRSMWTS